MSGFVWFFVGIAIGAAHGGLLWHAVQGLQPGSYRPHEKGYGGLHVVRLVCAGWLRNLGAALVLLLAMQCGLSAGLWALLGVTLARYVWQWRLAS